MSRFKRSFSAEYRKVLATKMWWIMALVLFLYTAMMAGTFAALFGAMSDQAGTAAPGAKIIYASAASFGYVVPLLFGAIMATTEIRYGVLGLAFIAEPKREIVLFVKLVMLLIVGVALGLAGVLASVGVGAPIYAALGGATELNEIGTWTLIARTVLAIALWAIIGFGLGLLLRSQAVTIVVALIFTQFLEPILRMGAMFWEWSANIARFFPGAATDSFIGASLINDLSAIDPTAPTGSASLTALQGGLVLLALAVITVLIAWVVRWRQDVQ